MGTKESPGIYDCHEEARPDEPMFVLLARDTSAPGLVERWADIREQLIKQGMKPAEDAAKVAEARMLARDMREWRRLCWPQRNRHVAGE